MFKFKEPKIKNTTDKSILSLINNNNENVAFENSNKNATILATRRDLIAGEISKDIVDRFILPDHIVNAHNEGNIHIHDKDFHMLPFINCCLINIADMLDNGTVMNNRMYETPRTFEKACIVTAQIISQVTSNQLGGNSINTKHLAKYLRYSFERHLSEEKETQQEYSLTYDEKLAIQRAKRKTQKSLRSGIRSLMYQINSFMTLSGQSPFVTLFLEIESGNKDEEYMAMIVEEIIKQRLEGMKNEQGVFISPSFPKLIFVLDENNVTKDSKYYHIKRKSIQCTAKRLVPDYISKKKMEELYEGNVYSPMGE